MKYKIILLNIFIIFSTLFGQVKQIDEQAFFENLKSSYYSLKSTTNKNISVLLTNTGMETFALKEWNNNEIFPLQLIWIAPDRLFISQLGVPSLSDSSTITYTYLVNELKSQITDILFDLKRFYFSDIYSGIEENYKINNINDVVRVSFSSLIKTDTTFYEYYFGLNGLCLKVLSYTPAKNLKVETIPHFKISKTKWIIMGWEVHVYSEEEIQTGYFVEISYMEKKNIWIPKNIKLTVQRKTDLGKTFNEVLKFRNLLFNQSLHYME